MSADLKKINADNRTWTCTELPRLAPEANASASFAISAYDALSIFKIISYIMMLCKYFFWKIFHNALNNIGKCKVSQKTAWISIDFSEFIDIIKYICALKRCYFLPEFFVALSEVHASVQSPQICALRKCWFIHRSAWGTERSPALPPEIRRSRISGLISVSLRKS